MPYDCQSLTPARNQALIKHILMHAEQAKISRIPARSNTTEMGERRVLVRGLPSREQKSKKKNPNSPSEIQPAAWTSYTWQEMKQRFSAKIQRRWDNRLKAQPFLHKSSSIKNKKKRKTRHQERGGKGNKKEREKEQIPAAVSCGCVAGGDRVGRKISPIWWGARGPSCLPFDSKRWNSGLPPVTYIRSGPPCPWCLAQRHNGVYMSEAR
jgi:hypothetical protein